MDRIRLEQWITENMKSVFGYALTRLGNVRDAEELASDILYEMLRSAENLKDEERFYGFLWKIAENTYREYLRRRAKSAGRTAELDEDIPDGADSPLDGIIREEERNLLRRELSLLSRQYRDAAVLYYIEDLSCSEVADRLQISVEMVKYCLFRARKIIREGMDMERSFGEKSYRPHRFEIDFWGTKGGDGREYQDFRRRKIKGNILLTAYDSPVTAQEISVELGVALPYLEDELSLLTERQYLVCKNGKVLTNIPIFTSGCTKAIDEKLKEHTEAAAERFIGAADQFSARFGDRFSGENPARRQKLLLCLHRSLIDTEDELEQHYGGLPDDGPYSLIGGGGGRGVVWGRSAEETAGEQEPQGIQGIYNGSLSADGRGSVIAMNFAQTLNAQNYEGNLTGPVVCTAVGCFAYLPKECQERLDELGYASDGKANFAVWTREEYGELRQILCEEIAAVTELNRKTVELAARITADFAPAHIRRTAEYVGAIVYRFHAADNLVSALYERNWLKPVGSREKPGLCVVKS